VGCNTVQFRERPFQGDIHFGHHLFLQGVGDMVTQGKSLNLQLCEKCRDLCCDYERVVNFNIIIHLL
jgi:hypothetical protein